MVNELIIGIVEIAQIVLGAMLNQPNVYPKDYGETDLLSHPSNAIGY